MTKVRVLIAAAGGLLLLVLVSVLLSRAQSARPTGAGGTPPPAQAARSSASFNAFVEDCRRNVDAWRRGQVSYPASLVVELDKTVPYRAGIDITGGSDLKARLSLDDDVEVSSLAVDVRCGLGARLVSANSSVEVDETEWVMRAFDQPGQVEWSWNVTGQKPGDYLVRLELRPAVAVMNGGYVVPAGDVGSSPVTTLPTRVEVTATWLQHLYLWWDENWGKIVAIGTALGAALLGIRVWVRKLRQREDRRPEPAGGAPGEPPEHPPGVGAGER